MNSIERYLDLFARYRASQTVLDTMAAQLHDMSSAMTRMGATSAELQQIAMPDREEVIAAMSGREDIWEALRSAWQAIPDDRRVGLSPPSARAPVPYSEGRGMR